MVLSLEKKTAVGFLLALILTGCAGTKPAHQSARDPQYTGKLNRTLMMYPEATGQPDAAEDFSQRLLERTAEKLGDRDLPSAILRLKSDRADRTKQIRAVTEQFNPTHVLYLELTGQPSEKDAGTSPVVIAFSVRDVRSGKIVWRIERSYVAWPKPEEVATELIKQLRIARLVEEPSSG